MLEVLYISAPWCAPCRALKPAIDKLELELDSSKVIINRINIDDNPELVSKYEVRSVPMFVFIKDSEMVDSFVGVKSIKDIQSIIEKWS